VALALVLEFAHGHQREQHGTHGEPAQQLEHVGPDALPAEVQDAAEGVRRGSADPEPVQDVPEGREHGGLDTDPGAGEVEHNKYGQGREQRADRAENELQAPDDYHDDEHVQHAHPEQREDGSGRPADGAEPLASEQVRHNRHGDSGRQEQRPAVPRPQGGRGHSGCRDGEDPAERAGEQVEQHRQAAGVPGRQRADIAHGELGPLLRGDSPEQGLHRVCHPGPRRVSDDHGRGCPRLRRGHVGTVQVVVGHRACRRRGRRHRLHVEGRAGRPF
jgi:hypothetical protein